MRMLEANEIRLLREKLGLNQTEFAARLGVSFFSVYRWETGERHPRWDMMRKLNEMATEAGLKLPSAKAV